MPSPRDNTVKDDDEVSLSAVHDDTDSDCRFVAAHNKKPFVAVQIRGVG